MPAYHRDATKRVVKHPKGYLRDSGLLHHLLHIPKLDSLLSHPSMGLSFEAMVIENIFRGFNNRGTPFEASHYRTSAGAEVDLVLEGPFGVLPVEIKYTQTLNMRRLRGLKDFISERYLTLGLVIHNGEEVRQLDDQIVAIPIGCL